MGDKSAAKQRNYPLLPDSSHPFTYNMFLEDNDLLYRNQFGFRACSETTHAVLKFTEHVYRAKEEKQTSISVFLDLKKAFDTVDHKILLDKLNKMGIKGRENEWFRNYLTGRKQSVCLDGTVSEERIITCGVPQGSILGPLLFLCYINDLPNATNFDTILFADDTTFQLRGGEADIYKDTNRELEKASSWFIRNKLTLHPDKTKFMVFNHDTQGEIKLQGKSLERIGENQKTKAFKFVGIQIDEGLKWHHQVQHVVSKVRKTNFTLRKLRNFLPEAQKRLIYNALFKPHIEFGLEIWGCASTSVLQPIIKAQKQSIRLVTNSKWRAHTIPLLEKLKTLELTDLHESKCLILVNKILNSKAPKSLSSIITQKLSARPQRKVFLETKIASTKAQSISPISMIPRMWNQSPLGIPNESLNGFKNGVKKTKLKVYSSFICKKQNCYSCK